MTETMGSDDVLAAAARWRDDGRRVALATVVATWGSSPRPVGSQLAVDAQGNMVGSVSGGCIEGAVVHEAGSVMESGAPKLLEYGVTDEMAWEVGLACGGTVKVFVERLD
ncbi:MAG: XdhC family protein [Proteobacteria bacterium]|nr:XdhC family protein [Pseudomonadota bacterium]